MLKNQIAVISSFAIIAILFDFLKVSALALPKNLKYDADCAPALVRRTDTTINEVSNSELINRNSGHYIVFVSNIDAVSAASIGQETKSRQSNYDYINETVLKNGEVVRSWSFGADEPSAFLVSSEDNITDAANKFDRISYAQPDSVVTSFSMQSDVTSWGLDVIDSTSFTTDGEYTYPESAGEGVDVYVLDSGINIEHSEFEGRAKWGKSFMPTANPTEVDDFGHGTHVAGIIGSKTYGVAKKANLIAVKVLDGTGTSTTSTIINGLDWVAQNYDKNKSNIINLSLGTSEFSSALNAAVQKCHDQGISVVVAAGNGYRSDACKYSPASSVYALTVGAANSNKTFAAYSNEGSCVDIFGPGTDILSVNSNSDTGKTMSGTSQATPFVTGSLALLLAEEKFNSPSDAYTKLKNMANSQLEETPANTTRLLLYTGELSSIKTDSNTTVNNETASP